MVFVCVCVHACVYYVNRFSLDISGLITTCLLFVENLFAYRLAEICDNVNDALGHMGVS